MSELVDTIVDATPLRLDDRLAPRRIDSVHIALTNDCNLRCTYCPIGTGKFDKSYVSSDVIEKLLAFIETHKINAVGLGYSGEFTKAPDWQLFVERLLSKGVVVSALSNFSKLFSAEEVDTFSKMRAIQMSVDSSDAHLERQFRRGLDIKAVVYNIGAIVARAENAGRPVPRLEWVCTINDKVVDKFESYVAFAISLGINQIIVHQFLPFEGLRAECKDVLKLSGGDLSRARDCIVAGIELGRCHDLEVLCQWLPLLTKKVSESESGAGARMRTVSFPSILGHVGDFYATDQDLSEGEAVRCTLPWQTLYVGGEGNVYPCAVSPYPLGNIGEVSTVDELLFNSKFQEWRQGSLSSHPQLPCRVCPVAGRCTLEEKRKTLDAMPRFGD